MVCGADAPANAQSSQPFSWTGWYVGANAGYGWGTSVAPSSFACTNTGACAYDTVDLPHVATYASGTLYSNKFTGGGQFGYNVQTGSFVVGIEGDVNTLKLSAVRLARGVPLGEAANNFTVTTSFGTDWVATVRGRLGVAVAPTALIYTTAGLAFTRITVSNQFVDDASTIPGLTVNTFGQSSATRNKVGWTAGGGGEWAFLGNWSVKAEYLYARFGSVSTIARVTHTEVAPNDPNLLTTSANLSAHLARIGLNWRP